jgi:ribose 5-phosphate isomerase A
MDLTTRLARLGEAAAAMVENGQIVGLGTGSTASAMIEALGKRVANGLRISGVVTSSQTEALATRVGIPLLPLDEIDMIDIGIDGADEIDPSLDLIKGRGGALLYEKIVAKRCRRYVIISVADKLVDQLGMRLPLPIEVVSYGWQHTAAQIANLGLNPELRLKEDGSPLVTDGGHYLLDCAPHPIANAATLSLEIKLITGVVDHGLFCSIATDILVIDNQGAITHQAR